MKTIKQITKALVFITILLLSTTTGNAQNQSITVNGTQIQVSPTVQNVLKQVETVYVKTTGYSINNFYNDAPDVIPTFIGLIMHRQEMMMNEIRNVEHLDNFLAVEKEIMAFLDQLAQAHNYRNPADNTSMPAARLNVYYLEAVRGNQNANFRNNMGIDPTKIDIAYLLDQSPSTNSITNNQYNNLKNTNKGYEVVQANQEPTNDVGGYGKIRLKDNEKKDEINLFGHVSGHADSFKKDHVDTKKWDPKKSFSSSIILGTWYTTSECVKASIVFYRSETGYEAKQDREDSYSIWEVRRVKGVWGTPEEKTYWIEHYKAIVRNYSKKDGKMFYSYEKEFQISPYRDRFVLQEYYNPHRATWAVYKLF